MKEGEAENLPHLHNQCLAYRKHRNLFHHAMYHLVLHIQLGVGVAICTSGHELMVPKKASIGVRFGDTFRRHRRKAKSTGIEIT
jgi:hypothetical protein